MRSGSLLIALGVANLLAFVWWHGELGSWFGSSREPERMRQQIDAERLRLLPGGAPPATSRGGPTATGAGAATDTPPTPPSVSAGSPAEQCVEIGPIEETRAARVRKFLADSGSALRGEIEPLADTGIWMVYSPPSDTLSIAQRKAADLRKLGVQDLYLMPDGPYRLGISFGLFRSEESARSLVESLTLQGVRGVRLALRGANEPKSAFRLYFAGADTPVGQEQARRLAALQTELGVNPLPCVGVRPGAMPAGPGQGTVRPPRG